MYAENTFFIFTFVFFNAFGQKNDTIFNYEMGITANLNKGNLDQILLGSNVLLSKSNKNIGFRFKSITFHQWLLGNNFDEDYYPNLVFFVKPLAKISPYTIARYEQSKRRGLDHREMIGAGISFLFEKQALHTFRLSTNLMYEMTTFTADNVSLIGNLSDKQRKIWRITGFLNAQHRFLKDNLHLNYEIWFQPTINNFNDFRGQIDLNLDNRLSKSLFLRMKLFYFYESVLPSNLKNGDLRASFGFVFKR